MLWRGRIYAFGNTCVHAGAPLAAGWLRDDKEVVCILHGAAYDLETGVCTAGPAEGGAQSIYKVFISGDDVYVGDRTLPVEVQSGQSWWAKKLRDYEAQR